MAAQKKVHIYGAALSLLSQRNRHVLTNIKHNYINTQRRIVCSCHKERWKTPALSEVMSCSATHELSTVAFGTERKRLLRATAYCPARPV